MKPHWKVILATIGVIVPSLFSYLASRSESTEAKIRAEVAYITMQETVKELQETSYAQALELAEIRGQLKGERHAPTAGIPLGKPGIIGRGVAPEKPEPVADADGIPDKPLPTRAAKPPSFQDAVQSYKAKK